MNGCALNYVGRETMIKVLIMLKVSFIKPGSFYGYHQCCISCDYAGCIEQFMLWIRCFDCSMLLIFLCVHVCFISHQMPFQYFIIFLARSIYSFLDDVMLREDVIYFIISLTEFDNV